MNNGKVVLGLLAGVASGALLGILFAPEKGSKMRKKLMNKKDVYVDELKKKFDEFVDSASEKYEKAKEDVNSAINNEKAKATKV